MDDVTTNNKNRAKLTLVNAGAVLMLLKLGYLSMCNLYATISRGR